MAPGPSSLLSFRSLASKGQEPQLSVGSSLAQVELEVALFFSLPCSLLKMPKVRDKDSGKRRVLSVGGESGRERARVIFKTLRE